MAKNSKYEALTLTGLFLKEAPSGKAFLVELHNTKTNEYVRKWIPYSQSKLPDGEEILGHALGYKEEITFTLPTWLAENEGMDVICRQQLLDQEDLGDDAEARDWLGIWDDDIPF